MMSSVIGGAMLPHAPQFFTMPETEDRDTVERVKTAAAVCHRMLTVHQPSRRQTGRGSCRGEPTQWTVFRPEFGGSSWLPSASAPF